MRSCASPSAERLRFARAAAWPIDRRASVRTFGRQRTNCTMMAGVTPSLSLRATVAAGSLPVLPRGQGNCGPPLPVADAGGTQFPQPRHWRAVAKQAREWHSRQGGIPPLVAFLWHQKPFLSSTGKKWVSLCADKISEHAELILSFSVCLHLISPRSSVTMWRT